MRSTKPLSPSIKSFVPRYLGVKAGWGIRRSDDWTVIVNGYTEWQADNVADYLNWYEAEKYKLTTEPK